MKALLCLFGLSLLVADQDPRRPRPVDVFAALDGTWRGTFVGYDPTGKELYRIAVQQTYKTVSDTAQEVEVTDRMQDGKVIRGRGRNTATPNKDGSVTLLCEVKKSNGEKVVHRGRIVRGPTGRKELVWFSKSAGRTEVFREWVSKVGGKTTYSIHGTGDYNGSLMLMAGEYTKVAAPRKPAK